MLLWIGIISLGNLKSRVLNKRILGWISVCMCFFPLVVEQELNPWESVQDAKSQDTMEVLRVAQAGLAGLGCTE